jgi:hypothetical protein
LFQSLCFSQRQTNYEKFKSSWEEYVQPSKMLFPFNEKHFTNDTLLPESFVKNSIRAMRNSNFLEKYFTNNNHNFGALKVNGYLTESFIYFSTNNQPTEFIYKPQEIMIFDTLNGDLSKFAHNIKALVIIDEKDMDVNRLQLSKLKDFKNLEYLEIIYNKNDNKLNISKIIENIGSNKIKHLAIYSPLNKRNNYSQYIHTQYISISRKDIQSIKNREWPLTHLWIPDFQRDNHKNAVDTLTYGFNKSNLVYLNIDHSNFIPLSCLELTSNKNLRYLIVSNLYLSSNSSLFSFKSSLKNIEYFKGYIHSTYIKLDSEKLKGAEMFGIQKMDVYANNLNILIVTNREEPFDLTIYKAKKLKYLKLYNDKFINECIDQSCDITLKIKGKLNNLEIIYSRFWDKLKIESKYPLKGSIEVLRPTIFKY